MKERLCADDDPRVGRPSTSATTSNIHTISELVQNDPHISVRGVAAATNLGLATVHKIMRVGLKLRTVFSAWVPYLLTDNNRADRVACAKQILSKMNQLGEDKLRLYCVEDETIIYFDAAPKKRGSRVWIQQTEKRPQADTQESDACNHFYSQQKIQRESIPLWNKHGLNQIRGVFA